MQVAASTVDKDGNINEGHIVSVRHDLGIGDVTQYTDLIERGMEYADR
jgi:predicted pyridoxine 5'-phosphate oxidase superfamily flavin-nucleotide-binding protein